MGRDIKKFVKSCIVCQRVKINKHKHVNCQARKFPNREDLFQDGTHRSGWTAAEGFNYILTAFDQASHYPIAVPLKSTEATEEWKQFKDNWIATFWVPTLLLSDRGSQFTSTYWVRAVPDVWHPQQDHTSLPSRSKWHGREMATNTEDLNFL